MPEHSTLLKLCRALAVPCSMCSSACQLRSFVADAAVSVAPTPRAACCTSRNRAQAPVAHFQLHQLILKAIRTAIVESVRPCLCSIHQRGLPHFGF